MAYLPADGAVAYELNGGVTWDKDTYIYADIANSLRWLVWAKTKDGEKNRNRPQMIKPSMDEESNVASFEIEELNKILSKKRI